MINAASLILPHFINSLTSAGKSSKVKIKARTKVTYSMLGGAEFAWLSQILSQKFYEWLVRFLGESHVPKQPPAAGTSPNPALGDPKEGLTGQGHPHPCSTGWKCDFLCISLQNLQVNKDFWGKKGMAAISAFPASTSPNIRRWHLKENNPNTEDLDIQSCIADVLL